VVIYNLGADKMSTNNKVALVTIPYQHYLVVPFEMLGTILNIQQVKQVGGWGSTTYENALDEKTEVSVISTSQITATPEKVLEIEAIMAENNALTRELEKLKQVVAAMKTVDTTSTDVSVV
jgi:hypothetical protein